jgi:2-hydroxy fatty acid dioxygenase
VAGHAVTWLDLVALMYGVYYMFIEQPGLAGPVASCMILGCWYSAQMAKLSVGADSLWQPCVGIHICCWIAQFYGHGAHEGRAPALLDNLFQAVFMAPLFVLMEVMFKFGYRKDFQVHIQKKVDIAIAEFKESTKKGK